MKFGPMITATTTDAEIDEISEQMWSVLHDLPKDDGKETFSEVSRAYRRMLRNGMTEARAVVALSTIALSVSGKSYDEIPGPRAKVRP